MKIESISVVYTQEDDLNSEDIQELIIETGDNGSGKYIVLKTNRWAIDDIDEMVKFLKDFKKREQ